MKRMKRTIVSLLAVFLLGACTEKEVRYESTEEIAQKLNDNGVNCFGYEPADKIIARESATCNLDGPDGETIELTVFNSNKSKESYMEIGAFSGQIDVTGDKWIAGTHDPDLAKKIHEALGGKIVAPE